MHFLQALGRSCGGANKLVDTSALSELCSRPVLIRLLGHISRADTRVARVTRTQDMICVKLKL